MALPGSSPGVEATQSADTALPLGRPGRRAWASRLGEYAGFGPALILFGAVLPRPARADRLLQLLADRRLQRRPRLDARQLPLLLQRPDLCPDAVGDGLGVGGGDGADARDRVPVCVLARTVRAEELPEASAHPRDPAVLDELLAQGLLVADDPRPAGRDEPLPPVDRSDVAAGLVLPLRPAGGHPRPRLPLLPVRRAHVVRIARAFRLEPVSRGDGPRRDSAGRRCGASSCLR